MNNIFSVIVYLNNLNLIHSLNGDGKLDVLIETVDGENIFLIFE